MAPERKIWTVSEVNSAVKTVIDGAFMEFWIQGEVGTLRPNPRSRHVYLVIKDSKCEIKATCFNGQLLFEKLAICNGTQIEARGRLGVYEPRGDYQFNILEIRPKGLGDLFRRFEELKNKLHAEGLFEQERKKEIPKLPLRVGIVTSPSGAAIRDFLQIINRRFPRLHVKIYPSPVQGRGAELSLAEGVRFFNRSRSVDVIILMRGGGSIEDLWPFNEEILARELASSEIPTISAVGHEIDFTICDMVADLRAPTPSASAELLISTQEEFQNALSDSRRRLSSAVRLGAGQFRTRFTRLAGSYVFKEPSHMIRICQQKTDEFSRRAENSLSLAVERAKMRLGGLSSRVSSLDPNAVLSRGYSLVKRRSDSKIITSSQMIEEGDEIVAVFAKGSATSIVTEKL